MRRNEICLHRVAAADPRENSPYRDRPSNRGRRCI